MTVRNYLEHALSSLTGRLAGGNFPARHSLAGHQLQEELDIGRKSPRFVLPDGGVCMTDRITHLVAPVRLPYPSIVVEFMDVHRDAHILFVRENGDKLSIVTAFKSEGYGDEDWQFANHVCVVPTADLSWMREDGEPSCAFFDLIGQQYIKPDRAMPGLRQSVIAIMSFIQALQCQNISTDTIPAPVALNKKRVRAGKLPFVDYHVLVLKRTASEAAELGGSHASPRRHIRRGHVRRLPNGNRIWIEQMFVGRADLGFVHKDYRVSA